MSHSSSEIITPMRKKPKCRTSFITSSRPLNLVDQNSSQRKQVHGKYLLRINGKENSRAQIAVITPTLAYGPDSSWLPRLLISQCISGRLNISGPQVHVSGGYRFFVSRRNKPTGLLVSWHASTFQGLFHSIYYLACLRQTY